MINKDKKAKAKQEEQKRMLEMIDKSNKGKFIKVRKGSKKYLKTVVLSIMTILRLYKESVNNKLRQRQDKLRDLEDALLMYMDIAKGWVVSSIKKPLISIISDPQMTFDFRPENMDPYFRESCIMKLNVRMKGILQELISSLDSQSLP